MNYGWGEMPAEQKSELAARLCKELKLPRGRGPGNKDPYVEVDRLYKGVRIRRITHLSDREIDLLVLKADIIYCQVTGRDKDAERLSRSLQKVESTQEVSR